MVDYTFPGKEQLLRGLSTLFEHPLTLLERRSNPRASTFPSERVVCLLPDGRKLALFCKYNGGLIPTDGHHGGVAYEAAVYEQVLNKGRLSFPRYYGSYSDPVTGEVWLVLEALDGFMPINNSAEPTAMAKAAAWLGCFHRDFTSCSSIPLRIYDTVYYLGWAHRTAALSNPLYTHFPWLATLCERFEQTVPLLLEETTAIHGEFYPHNVLYRSDKVCPVDWETAALAAAEIDLACLTDNWSDAVTKECAEAYAQARWSQSPSGTFEHRLTVARLYLHLRWLGDRSSWTLSESHRWRFDKLRLVGERLRLI